MKSVQPCFRTINISKNFALQNSVSYHVALESSSGSLIGFVWLEEGSGREERKSLSIRENE